MWSLELRLLINLSVICDGVTDRAEAVSAPSEVKPDKDARNYKMRMGISQRTETERNEEEKSNFWILSKLTLTMSYRAVLGNFM